MRTVLTRVSSWEIKQVYLDELFVPLCIFSPSSSLKKMDEMNLGGGRRRGKRDLEEHETGEAARTYLDDVFVTLCIFGFPEKKCKAKR